jgi:PAS domain S-box-containing protein
VALAAAALLSARLQRRISEPLGSLIATANQVRESESYAARATKYRDDELGRLTDTVNAMLDHIESVDAALRRSQRRYRELFNTPLVGIFSVDTRTGNAMEANSASARLLGYADVPALKEGFTLGKHAPDLDSAGAVRHDIAEAGEVHGIELRYFPISGEERWATFSGRCTLDGEVLECAIADISDRKRAEHNVRALEKHVRHQQKLESIGTLASGVAHEINNPIQAIIGQAELLSLEPGVTNEVRETAGAIIEQSERIARIVGSLLTFARKEPEQRRRENAQQLIDETIYLMTPVMRKDGIRLEVDYQDHELSLVCDKQQLQQVLMNLLTNARDALNARYEGASPEKLIHVTLSKITFEGSPWVRITVEDFGTGMPASIRERVFDPFFTTKRTKGTGLGLSVGFGIVADHGGRLSVESEEGRYTRFHVDLRPADNQSES